MKTRFLGKKFNEKKKFRILQKIFWLVSRLHISTSSSCAASLCIPTSSWLACNTLLYIITIIGESLKLTWPTIKNIVGSCSNDHINCSSLTRVVVGNLSKRVKYGRFYNLEYFSCWFFNRTLSIYVGIEYIVWLNPRILPTWLKCTYVQYFHCLYHTYSS